MAIDLCGWRIDGGVGLTLNAREPRGFRAVAIASGTASKIEVLGHASGTARLAIYSNNPANNRPLNLLAYTTSYSVTAAGLASLSLNTNISIVLGDSYHIVPVQTATGGVLRSGTASSTQRSTGSTMAAITDAFADPFSFVTGASVTAVPYAMLIADGASISAINHARTGQTSRIDFNAEFAPATVSITGDTITKNITPSVVDADSVDAVVPAWVDGQACVKIGPVTFTATDGVTTTDPFNDDLEFWSAEADDPAVVQFTPIEISSLATGNLSSAFGLTPAWQVGTQVIFNSARALIGVDGVYGGNYTGESYVWYRNPDDKIARQITVTTQDGEIISVSGLTTRGLTNTGLSTPGLTTRGL